MTNKDKTGTARQQARRKREKEWLSAHGFTSWEQLNTKLMSGEIVLDNVTPAYSRPKTDESYANFRTQLTKAIIQHSSIKKGKQS